MTRDERKALEGALWDWGKWVRSPVPGLYYPNMSIEARINAGGRSTKQEDRWPKYEPHPAQKRLDEVVMALEPKFRLVIEARYVFEMSGLDGQRLGIKYRTFYDRLDRALQKIYVRLGERTQIT